MINTQHDKDTKKKNPINYWEQVEISINRIARDCEEALSHQTPWGNFCTIIQDRLERESKILAILKTPLPQEEVCIV